MGNLHKLLHMPYRSWCSDCVKGRGMASQHRKCKREEKKGVSQVAMDYFFPAPNLTCIAVKDIDSQAVMASVVPKKGGSISWTVRQIKQCIDKYWGRKRIIMRSDGEPSIVDLKQELQLMRQEETMLVRVSDR